MFSKIENEHLRVEVNSMGAELHSIKEKDSGIEYLWQPDPDVWMGQSPLLFPIVGTLLNNTYTVNGVEYKLPRHGFAQYSEFQVKEEGEALVYTLKSSAETKKQYPFDFDLRLSYALDGMAIKINHTVLNTGAEDMYFSLGAHPGINCEMGDWVEFENDETLQSEYVDENGIIIEETHSVLNNSRKIIITEDIFKRDALLLSGYSSTKAAVKRRGPGGSVEVTFGGAPFLGIWAKPGAKYVCIEPWFGIADDYKHNGDLTQKRGIIRLEPNGRFEFPYSIRIL